MKNTIKIRIRKKLHVFNEEFDVATPGSTHDVLKVTERGVWIQGKTEPILILRGEFSIIND